MRRLFLVAALAVALFGYAWVELTERPLRPLGAAPIELDVAPGTRADGIGSELHRLGLVPHPVVFRLLVWRRGSAGRLRAGRYSLPGGASLTDVAAQFERGEAVRHDLTFPEGKSLAEAATLAAGAGVDREAFLAAARDAAPIRDLDPEAPDLEGYLFPDTYDVPQGEAAARALVRRMLARFRSVATPLLPRVAESGRSLREVVTLASIVELETARAEERPRVAAVFLNRLRKGMLLQTDPTVIYALRQAGPYDGNIRKKDLELDSPYNTYRYPGLPPGPIASPGRDSLLAVLAPAAVKDLYFVSRNDGTHEFNESLRQHELAVTRYQRLRARPVAAPPSQRR